jgi:hypothetical protein
MPIAPGIRSGKNATGGIEIARIGKRNLRIDPPANPAEELIGGPEFVR